MPQNSFTFSQKDFAARLFNAEAAAPNSIVDPDGKHAPKRFSVYKNNVMVSYLEALAAAYPACKNLVGEEFFNAIGRAYLAKVPPDSQLMILFGKGFAEFVRDYPPAQQIPFLTDVAQLERTWRVAYHSADIAPIGVEKLSALPQERLDEATMTFLPSFAVISSPFPVFNLWHAALNMQPLDHLDPQEAQTAMIVRPDIDVNVSAMPTAFAKPILSLKAGNPIKKAAEIGLQETKDFDFSGLFTLLIQTGAIADIIINEGE